MCISNIGVGEGVQRRKRFVKYCGEALWTHGISNPNDAWKVYNKMATGQSCTDER